MLPLVAKSCNGCSVQDSVICTNINLEAQKQIIKCCPFHLLTHAKIVIINIWLINIVSLVQKKIEFIVQTCVFFVINLELLCSMQTQPIHLSYLTINMKTIELQKLKSYEILFNSKIRVISIVSFFSTSAKMTN